MANIYRAKLDIKTVRPDFKPTFVQYDHARLEIKLTDGGKPYNLSNASRVEFTHVLGDNTVIIQPGEIVRNSDGYVVIYNYQGSEMDLRGTVKTSFAIFDEVGKKVSSPVFEVNIVKDLRDDTFSPAEPNAGLLQKLISDVEYVKASGGIKGDPGYTPLKGIDYFDGKDGEPFTFEKFTPQQLASLKGERGEKGEPFTYSNFTQSQLEALRGPKGEKGDPGLGDERLDSFMLNVVPITSSARRLSNGIVGGDNGVTVVDNETIEYTTNTTYGHAGLAIVGHSVTKKYLSLVKITNIGTITINNARLSLAYSSWVNSVLEVNGATLRNLNSIAVGATYEEIVEFTTTNDTYANAMFGLLTGTNGAVVRLTQKVYDVTNLSTNEINQINWATIENDVVLKASYAEKSSVATSIEYRGSKWQGKTWITIGDSITSPGVYQNLVKNALGFGSILNKGIAGQGMYTMLDNVSSAEIQSADLITIYGALNHMYPKAPAIGNITDTPSKSSGSFIAQLKFLIEAIFTIRPTARVVIIGTHNSADEYRPDIYQPIQDGKNIGDYVLAMGDVARYYGCPFIDVYGKCGFNAFNLMTYTNDGAHPNTLGYQRIAEVIAGELQQIEPI